MADVGCPQYLPSSPNHAPCPPCVSPEIYIALVVAAPVAVIFWFWRNLHRPLLELEQLPHEGEHQIPAIPDAPTVGSSIAPPQAEAAYPSPSDGSGPSRAGDEKEDGDEPGRAELTPAFINATVDRSCDVAGILDKMSHAFWGIFLDVHNSDESTIHPANGLLMEFLCGNTDAALSIFGTADSTIEHCSAMLDCWLSKLEEEGERIFQGEKGQMYIFLLNNAYDVLQMMRCRGASFSKLISVIERYKKCFFDECWVPLINPCRLDKFTSVFDTICKRQMTWKVTAELRYTLRQEIVDLILPPYELSLLALKANQSPLSEILYWLKRLMARKKKQKNLTLEALEKVIKDLFEG